MERVIRVRYYEELFDEALALEKRLSRTLEVYQKSKPILDELEEYEASGLWQEDYEADEAGELPKDLKRGVLSQDGLFDLLQRLDELKEEYIDVFTGEEEDIEG